ncbi:MULTISPECIES: TetR/AcrR family transcriptional regulator [Mumia]|uniref:TetR/AcrR family transcriptional regulator n=1 Tax=Mumia xiangluensis TaxID=1678900 RepID=A0ABW1QKV7_9ACTN|nr:MULTISPECIES: TetR/AcrR family transcriptional regulator [Mumia]
MVELPAGTPPRRADARRNISAIVEAATRCLAEDPGVSMSAIATAAGVGRMTLYGHFESRSALVAVVVEHALDRAEAELSAVDVTGDPYDAMTRLLDASWTVTFRNGGLVQAADQALSPDLLERAHTQLVDRAKSVLRRGRSEGRFRKDMPLDWQVTAVQSLLHGAATAVHQGALTAARAPGLVTTSALALLAVPPAPSSGP